jgi:hypothetical protein
MQIVWFGYYCYDLSVDTAKNVGVPFFLKLRFNLGQCRALSAVVAQEEDIEPMLLFEAFSQPREDFLKTAKP